MCRLPFCGPVVSLSHCSILNAPLLGFLVQEVTTALVQLQREESAAAATAAAAGGSTDQQQQQQQEASSAGAAGGGGGAVSAAEQRVRDLVDKACYLVRTSQTLNPSE